MDYHAPDNQLLQPQNAELGVGDEVEHRVAGTTVEPGGVVTPAPEDAEEQPEGDENDLELAGRVFDAISVSGESPPEPDVEDDLKAEKQAMAKLQQRLNKQAGVENEPAAPAHASAPDQPLRPRAEVVVFDQQGVWGIDNGEYLLFPGGGIDDGEIPIVAAARETMEEADIHPLNIQARQTVECLWPSDSGNDFWDDSDFSGERTYFFIALHGGKTEFDHPDREPFEHLTFKQARQILRNLIKDPDQSWARENNRRRLQLVNECARLARLKSQTQPVKLADGLRLRDEDEYLLFTPEGKVVVGERKNRRFRLPQQGMGEPVPYGEPVRLIPDEGLDEEGYHGLRVNLHRGLSADAPEGYDARDPAEVLSDLYASMGMPENRAYRDLDRARARAILQEVRRRRAEDL